MRMMKMGQTNAVSYDVKRRDRRPKAQEKIVETLGQSIHHHLYIKSKTTYMFDLQ